jgi:hypothetical protein
VPRENQLYQTYLNEIMMFSWMFAIDAASGPVCQVEQITVNAWRLRLIEVEEVVVMGQVLAGNPEAR